MIAGFSKKSITPPLGTHMSGLGTRDIQSGCTSVHDDVFVRALFCEHDGEAALVISFDLCFIGREDSDRIKGFIGREFDILPKNILLSATHNHAGPAVGTWYNTDYIEPDRLYLRFLDATTLEAVGEARDSAVEVTIHAGSGCSKLPVNRRLVVDGKAYTKPNLNGPVSDTLPVCLFKDSNGEAVCLLFSVATHPSIMRSWEISADFCGVACDLLDEHFAKDVSLFLQGTGGDSKPSTIVAGEEWNWASDWKETQEAGEILAAETIAVLSQPLETVSPLIHGAIVDTQWPLQNVSRSFFEDVLAGTGELNDHQIGAKWATRQLEKLDRFGAVPEFAPVLMQGLQLGEGLRLIAIEGEPVSYYGQMILEMWPDGTTFPLGYANGEAMYLVITPMLSEGAMEVESYYEYGFPARLAPGMEPIAARGLHDLKERGVN